MKAFAKRMIVRWMPARMATRLLFLGPKRCVLYFLAQRVLCDRVADRLGDAETARLTSDAGTDLLLRLGKRPANSHPGRGR